MYLISQQMKLIAFETKTEKAVSFPNVCSMYKRREVLKNRSSEDGEVLKNRSSEDGEVLKNKSSEDGEVLFLTKLQAIFFWEEMDQEQENIEERKI